MTCWFLRIYANTSADEAQALAGTIETALLLSGPVVAASPRPYWKMPELFEFTYRLSSPTRDVWSELLAQGRGGWTIVEDGDKRPAVWNRAHDRLLLVPAVQWAELAGPHSTLDC
jgi:hypothetical protein